MTALKRVRPAQWFVIHDPDARPSVRWYFNCVAQNGNILCHGRGYNSRAAALKGIAAVRAASNMVIEK